MDVHLHTPASSDYQQPKASYLDILQRAEKRGLDIISFTDHNTVAGYRKMMEEIDHLRLLKSLNRILPEEDALWQSMSDCWKKFWCCQDLSSLQRLASISWEYFRLKELCGRSNIFCLSCKSPQNNWMMVP